MNQTESQIDKEIKELVTLSKSMSQAEKDGWLQMLAIMNDDQKAELKTILTTEKQKLDEIDAKYRKKISSIEKKYFVTYVPLKAREKQQAVFHEEQKSREQTEEAAEELLENL
jgi:hypothetical protein